MSATITLRTIDGKTITRYIKDIKKSPKTLHGPGYSAIICIRPKYLVYKGVQY